MSDLIGATATCADCLRRSWLLAALAPNLDLVWKQRRPLRDVLALDDVALVETLGGKDRLELVARSEAFDAAAALRTCERAGVEPVCVHDPRFPRRLRTGPGGPRLLHVAGGLGRLGMLAGAGAGATDLETVPAVAIVGTRNASPEGLEMARALGRGLARAGVTVVSGMALGIDSAAHVGALEGGGATVAVLAGAAEVAYPRSKAGLHEQILARACAVSELPPGFEPFRWCFPARNRIIAGLAELTLVVEGAEKSGSLITADFASALGREVAAVPGRATSPRTRGSNGLIRDGATVILGVDDVLDAVLGFERASEPARSAAATAALAPGLAVLLDAVAAGRDTVAALALTPAEADAALLGLSELEGHGLVRRSGGGRYVVVSR
ncbi:MAG: Rossmann fold nucleotide-binding protein Smf possibly involved in DNA uptake [uncultured Solirubrobacteraceae bacterium]|uniref:Rossmann fold nucleotide-binding protein Smf possibly involved in DNA uptake n=1 Tax=uncultured Solirubrobacteraceae bacterium TaxID=1162706 RepID=A0A6J4RXM8_9ACTN|nr:MAG: Rossmann fold nucleotide-binding protein Smf possibly involved in DNA uptake [uncultured Solirubrobacteraceae bacterium]